MIRRSTDRVTIRRGLLCVAGLLLTAGLLAGCCTVDCCTSTKCPCDSPQTRVLLLVDSRVDGCPDTWTDALKVTAGDTMMIVNRAGKKAKVKFTPPGFFDEGDMFEVQPGDTQELTVSSGVVEDQILGFTITSPGTPCSHGGPTIIVTKGP